MKCERLINLAKNWYLHVKDETMAPARMIQFMKEHVETCEICQNDPDIHDEIEKITELILPESKIPKAVRLQQEKENSEMVDEVEEEEVDENPEEDEKDEYMDDDDEIGDDEFEELE